MSDAEDFMDEEMSETGVLMNREISEAELIDGEMSNTEFMDVEMSDTKVFADRELSETELIDGEMPDNEELSVCDITTETQTRK